MSGAGYRPAWRDGRWVVFAMRCGGRGRGGGEVGVALVFAFAFAFALRFFLGGAAREERV